MSFTFLQCEDVNKYLCSQRHIDIWTDKPFHLIASWRTQATRSNSTWGQVKATVHSVIPLTDSKWNHHFTLSSSFSPSWLASIFSSNFTLHGYCLFGPPLSLPNVYIYTYTHTHSVQSLSHVQLFATPWTAACQASPSITNSQSLCNLMFIKSVMPSNHLILCRPLLLPPLIFPSIRVFSNESVLHIRWPKYWSWSFSISSSNEYSGLISFGMDWIDLLTV